MRCKSRDSMKDLAFRRARTGIGAVAPSPTAMQWDFRCILSNPMKSWRVNFHGSRAPRSFVRLAWRPADVNPSAWRQLNAGRRWYKLNATEAEWRPIPRESRASPLHRESFSQLESIAQLCMPVLPFQFAISPSKFLREKEMNADPPSCCFWSNYERANVDRENHIEHLYEIRAAFCA